VDALRKERTDSAADLEALLESRLVAAIETSIQSSVFTAIKDMRTFTDGAEHELHQELADLRV
jgi:hypothetical protein